MNTVVANPAWWAVFIAGVSLLISMILAYAKTKSTETLTRSDIENLKSTIQGVATKSDIENLKSIVDDIRTDQQRSREDRGELFRGIDRCNKQIYWLAGKMGHTPPNGEHQS